MMSKQIQPVEVVSSTMQQVRGKKRQNRISKTHTFDKTQYEEFLANCQRLGVKPSEIFDEYLVLFNEWHGKSSG